MSDFYSTFARKSNAETVAYPGSTMTFQLLPKGHPDAMKNSQTFMSLSTMDNYMKFLEEAKEDTSNLSIFAKYFETMADAHNVGLQFQAAMIEGWSGVEENGQPVVFSHEKAYELLKNAEPFAKWVDEQTAILGEKYEAEREKIEDTKKKSQPE